MKWLNSHEPLLACKLSSIQLRKSSFEIGCTEQLVQDAIRYFF